MSLVVLIYYLFYIVPDTFYNFCEFVGRSDSTYSKLVSLRRLIWMRGDDRFEQQVGFRMDMYMNTGKISLAGQAIQQHLHFFVKN